MKIKFALGLWSSVVLLTAGASVLLQGCNPMATTRDVNSRYYDIPPGSTLTLHQDISYPQGKAQVDIQHGRVSPGLDNWDVGCEIVLRELGPGVVKADTFTVKRASSSQEWVNRPSTMRFYRTIYFDSGPQPNVMRMECQYWSYPLQGDDIPMSAIREALGNVATFEFAQQTATQ